MKTICVYHANCFDGMAAAWVVLRKYPDAELIPANHGDSKLMNQLNFDAMQNANINDRLVIVDFSFPREMMKLLNGKYAEMIVIDHHKTAQKDCEGFNFCIFDMEESGASLAWKHYFPTEPFPTFIKYIKDRDLWNHKEAFTWEVNAFIQSHDMTPEDYEYMKVYFEQENGFNNAVIQGKAILRYKNRQVKAIISQAKMMQVGGHLVPVVNSNTLMSEVGHELCKAYPNAPFGAYYFDRADGMRQWGARSIGEFDVSEIAKQFGGGGHRNAAGWQEKVS